MKKEQKKTATARKELVRLLAVAVDGIDGYESETGTLKFWNKHAINEARIVLAREGAVSTF